MKKNRVTDEQVVAVLRNAEATTVVEAARKHGVVEQSIYRWRNRLPAWKCRMYESSSACRMKMPVSRSDWLSETMPS